MSAAAAGPRRRALVTGASSGIGRAFAHALAREQYDLVLVARSGDSLNALARELEQTRGIEAVALPADLSEPSGLAAVEAGVTAEPLALLVNSAGFGSVGRFAELSEEAQVRMIELNVLALVRLTRAALPAMIERGAGGVVNVSSLAGESAFPFMSTYAATKAFVTSFSESLSEEVRGSGVRIQALIPGFVRTGFQDAAGVDPGSVPGPLWLAPEDVAEASLAALAEGRVLCVPGSAYRASSWFQRRLPRSLARRAAGWGSARALGLD